MERDIRYRVQPVEEAELAPDKPFINGTMSAAPRLGRLVAVEALRDAESDGHVFEAAPGNIERARTFLRKHCPQLKPEELPDHDIVKVINNVPGLAGQVSSRLSTLLDPQDHIDRLLTYLNGTSYSQAAER